MADADANARHFAQSMYADHANFVFRSLQRLGVRAADLEDVLQEVFIVVHRRAHTFQATAKPQSWLYGICLRVASAYRRRGFRRHEDVVAELPVEISEANPEEDASQQQARRVLSRILDAMDLDKRAVLVMFEVDEMSCDEIADSIGVPVGTVYSRLHAARKAFQRELARVQVSWQEGGER